MRTEDIQPLSEVRPHLTQHIRQAQESGRPLFVTSNGRTAAVLLSPAAYDELAEKARLAENLAMIDRSVDDLQSGRVRDARQAIHDLAAKHGIPLD